MGKKSKRNRNKQSAEARVAPAVRSDEPEEEETLENLRFEDPFVDEVEDEDMLEEGAEYEDDEDDDGMVEVVQSWHPLQKQEGDQQEQPEKLEMDPSAYKMHHTLTPEWPSLSFDFLRDDLGEARTRFPHSLIAAVGTQADTPQNNQLTIMKLSDLSKLQQEETEEDILGDEYDSSKKKNNDDDDDSSDSSEEEVDLDPILEHFSLPHYGGVNRVRVMPQKSDIVATWSDVGKVNLYNVGHILSRFSMSEGRQSASGSDGNNNKPFFTHSGHSTEGFALDWSSVKQGYLSTGDCAGNIHLWTPRPEGGYEVTPSYSASENVSVEDLQWSPTEGTVFSAAECGGTIKIYDTRAPNRAMLSHKIHSNGSDVNVMSWNPLVGNLLATGGDDGTFSVWDLRHFSGKSSSCPSPLARFTSHKTPITSVEWHPTDESMIAVSDDVGAYIYDLSVEEDADADTNAVVVDDSIPPQMLFVHCGSRQFKEVHWHPQISSCLMTTALTGFSVFIPSNL